MGAYDLGSDELYIPETRPIGSPGLIMLPDGSYIEANIAGPGGYPLEQIPILPPIEPNITGPGGAIEPLITGPGGDIEAIHQGQVEASGDPYTIRVNVDELGNPTLPTPELPVPIVPSGIPSGYVLSPTGDYVAPKSEFPWGLLLIGAAVLYFLGDKKK